MRKVIRVLVVICFHWVLLMEQLSTNAFRIKSAGCTQEGGGGGGGGGRCGVGVAGVFLWAYFNDSVQEWSNSVANASELLQSCKTQSLWFWLWLVHLALTSPRHLCLLCISNCIFDLMTSSWDTEHYRYSLDIYPMFMHNSDIVPRNHVNQFRRSYLHAT